MTAGLDDPPRPAGPSRLDGLAALAGVRTFLAEEILPVVPAELAGELRAAVKLLGTVRTELLERPASLHAELTDLLGYSRRIGELLGGSSDAADPAGGVAATDRAAALAQRAERPEPGDLEEIRREARDLCTARLARLLALRRDPDTPPRLRAEADRLAADCCARLGEHARARLVWQSVFPAPTTRSGGTDR